ncbi:MLK-1 protein, partial [Aphelenchoides avenae]
IRCLRSQIEGIFKNLAVATCGSCGYDFSPVHAQHNQHSQGLVATNSIAASFYEPGQLVARDQSDTLRQTGEQVGLSVGFTEEEVHGLSNPHALASKAHSRPAEMAQRNINRPFSLDLINEYIQEENNREQVTGSSQYRTNDNNIVRYALVYEESNRQGEAVSEIEGILSQLQLGGFGSPGQTQVPHQTSICAESIQQPIRFSANDITHYELEDHSTDSDYDTLSVVSEATTLSLAHGDLRRSFSARSRGGLSFSRGPAGEEPKSSASEMTKNLEVIDETKELETIPTQGRSMASTWPVHVIKPEAIVRSKEKVVMQYVQLSRATLKVADNEDPIAVTLKEPLVKFSIMKGRNMLKYPHQWGRMKVEAELLSRLNHPNVVSCYGICLKPRPAAMFEACEGGTLKDLYKSLRYTDVITIVGWLTQIASGMAHLHKNGITMKNSYLNTQNISLKQQACRGGQDKRHPPCRGICDGDGNCVICGGRSLDHITLKIVGIGIDSCALQEVLLPNMGNARRAQAANDVYSFVMVQWELMNNLMLRHDETKGLRTPQTASNIVENCLPDALKDIALKCSSKVSHRPTFDECVEMLADARQSLLGSSRWRFSHSAKTSDGYQHAAPSVYAPNFLRQ